MREMFASQIWGHSRYWGKAVCTVSPEANRVNWGKYMQQEFSLEGNPDDDADAQQFVTPEENRFAQYMQWADLPIMLNNQTLQLLVDILLPDLATSQLAVLLGKNPDWLINCESLYQYLGLPTDQAEAALIKLANAGFIELIEFAGDDPLFATVADAEKVKTLILFSRLSLAQN